MPEARLRVLGLDTSTELGSVAVLVEGQLRARIDARVRARHGETLLPLIERALQLGAVGREELELIAVGIGPGSFTGTRVGVATAKGLAIALDLPVVGVVSLSAIARGAPGAWVAPIVDAHKGEVYVALYERRGAELLERLAPLHAPPAQAAARLRAAAGEEAAITACGSGLRRYEETVAAELRADLLPPVFDAPAAALVALEGAERFARAGRGDDRAALEPLYVRPSDAKLPKGG